MSSSWSMRLSEGVEEPHSALSTLRNFQKKITEHVITLGGNPEEALATLNQSASLNRNESFSDYSTHAAQCTSITCIDKVPYISDNSNCNDGQNVDVHNISIQRRLALHEDRRKAYLEGKSIPSSLNVQQGTSHAMESRSHTRLALFDPRNLPFEVHESPFQVTSIEQGAHQYSAVVETQPSYTAACRELPNNRNTFDPMVIPFPVTTSPFEERAASLQAMQTIQTRKTNRRASIKNSLTKHADPTQTLVIPEIPNQLEEHDWSHVPRIPVPEEMQRKQWWQCKGHDYILQLMEAWGKTPTNSPSLAEEIMTHELISCFEALELGEQVVLYQEDEPPHERFFYIKLLRCRKRGRMLPFLCWAQHNRSSSALDFISLLDLVYAHHGPHSELFMNYTIHNNGMLKGPKAGNKRRILMPNGALSLWFLNDHDPSRMRSLDMLTLEPLSLARWLYLFENVSALNAMLDVSGQMRHAREHLRDTMTMKVRQGTRGQILDYTPGSRCPVDI